MEALHIRHKNLCESTILKDLGHVFTRSKDGNGGRAYHTKLAEKKRELTKQAMESLAAENQ